MSVVVSIVNYQTAELTIGAVRSALADLGSRNGQVIVIDNASGDGSAERIACVCDDRVSVIQSGVNSGFSGGHNQALAAAPRAEFYLLLNSDAVLRPGFFDSVMSAAERHPKVGLIAPRLEDADGTPQVNCFRLEGPLSELMRGAETGPVSSLFRRREVALDYPPRQDQIEWASFACILLRGDMVREIGPLDDGYFLYYEDAAYALRARRAGWSIAFEPEARAVHFRGGSGPVKAMQRTRGRLPQYFWRSRARYLRQAHGRAGPLLGNLAWILGRFVAQGRRLVGRRVPVAHEGEWVDIWTGFLSPLRRSER